MDSLNTECLRQLINGKDIRITHCNKKSGGVVMQSVENQTCDQQTGLLRARLPAGCHYAVTLDKLFISMMCFYY